MINRTSWIGNTGHILREMKQKHGSGNGIEKYFGSNVESYFIPDGLSVKELNTHEIPQALKNLKEHFKYTGYNYSKNYIPKVVYNVQNDETSNNERIEIFTGLDASGTTATITLEDSLSMIQNRQEIIRQYREQHGIERNQLLTPYQMNDIQEVIRMQEQDSITRDEAYIDEDDEAYIDEDVEF